MITQKRTELEAKRQLIMNGTVPKLELVDLEAQLKAAEAALAAAEAERDRGVVRAPWSRRRARRGGRGRPGRFLHGRPRDRDDRRARSDAGGGRGRRAQARRRQGRRHRRGEAGHRRERDRKNPLRRQDREPDHAHLSRRGRAAEPRRYRSPTASPPRCDAGRAGAGDAGAALGADHSPRPATRRARGRRGRNRRVPSASRSSRTSRPSCGSPAFPTARG